MIVVIGPSKDIAYPDPVIECEVVRSLPLSYILGRKGMWKSLAERYGCNHANVSLVEREVAWACTFQHYAGFWAGKNRTIRVYDLRGGR
jgi:hypothetical protein